MQKLGLQQTQQSKLSPKQLQFIQMLQVPSEALLTRVQEEIFNNPTLEEEPSSEDAALTQGDLREDEGPSLSTFLRKRYRSDLPEEYLHSKLGTLKPSAHEKLLEQIALLSLTPKERTIAHHLIGSLSPEGYLKSSLEAIAYYFAFTHYLEVDTQEIADVLYQIQGLDPPGIGARDLQECLLLQLRRKPKHRVTSLAIKIVTHCFDLFSKKNYRKIITSLKISDEALFKEAITCITQLSPKPVILTSQVEPSLRKYPDFIVQKDENGTLTVSLYHDYTPSLRIRRQYQELLKSYDQRKDEQAHEVTQFVRKNIQRARWFMEAIQKRKNTLLRTMEAIVDFQRPFFESQDEKKLRPLFMRHVAQWIGMDVSTVSRAVNGKSVATDMGILPLKYFFSESMATTEGAEASTRTIKAILQKVIDAEDKKKPYTDEALVAHMKGQGYMLARRTVAKYRSQLGLPVARMRKKL